MKKYPDIKTALVTELVIMTGTMGIVTLIAQIFWILGFHEANIIILFILGVLFVSRLSYGYLPGIGASILGVMLFNFFFTEPRYTFSTYDSEYFITFLVMIIVALITSTLTTKVKQEVALSHLREKRNEILYNISRNLLTTNSIEQTISIITVNISNICKKNVVVYLADKTLNLLPPYVYTVDESTGIRQFLSENEHPAVRQVLNTNQVIDGPIYYFPIQGRALPLGVIGIDCSVSKLSTDQKLLFHAIAAQAALSIEREISNRHRQESQLEADGERMRSNLLRSVSHDLKTPLTGIVGSSSTLLESWDYIEDAEKRNLLSGILDDSLWLTHSVENILNITKMEDGRVEVRKSKEAAEEIIAEAVYRISKQAGNRQIQTEVPDELMLVSMDGLLMKLLMVNLLDNAIHFTPDDGIISIRAYISGSDAVFEVADNGVGIAENDLPFIFDRFFTVDHRTPCQPHRKGMGLGLAICKAIAAAHNGQLTATNIETGGALFRVTLPIGE